MSGWAARFSPIAPKAIAESVSKGPGEVKELLLVEPIIHWTSQTRQGRP